MPYKNFVLYCGNEVKSFESYFNGNKVSVKSDTYVEEDWDSIANSEITNIQNISASLSGSNAVISFSPISNENLLFAIDNDLTRIRIQLLVQQPSSRNQAAKDHRDNTGIYIDLSDLDGQLTNPKWMFIRARATWVDFQGITWKTLTANELRSGQVILNNVKTGLLYRKRYTKKGKGSYLRPNQRIAFELYVPKLHISNSNMFDYENQGFKKISNVLEFNIENT